VDDLSAGENITNDLSEYVGLKVKLIKPYTKIIKSKYGKDKDGKGITLPAGQEVNALVLVVETEQVFTYKDKEGVEKPWRASELFSLKEEIDADGKKKVTWSTHEKGALNKFLKKMKIDHPNKLEGKVVQITTRGSEENQSLGFIKE
jgi:hypothetical protein